MENFNTFQCGICILKSNLAESSVEILKFNACAYTWERKVIHKVRNLLWRRCYVLLSLYVCMYVFFISVKCVHEAFMATITPSP